MKSIVTLTVNPAIDVAASVPKVFPDHKLRCGIARRDAGGGGLNVSRAIRLLGGKSLACYFAGGPSGDMLEALLEAETLRHRRLPIKGWTRENFTATEEATGSQYPFVLRGPTLSEKEWQRGLDLLETEAEQNAAAMELIETRGCEAVVVSLGERGALLASREGCERFASPDVEVQSRVGAGDSTVAGISLALSRGESLREAVRFGVAVGAATVMKPGTELCRREDAERLFRQMTTGTEAR